MTKTKSDAATEYLASIGARGGASRSPAKLSAIRLNLAVANRSLRIGRAAKRKLILNRSANGYKFQPRKTSGKTARRLTIRAKRLSKLATQPQTY